MAGAHGEVVFKPGAWVIPWSGILGLMAARVRIRVCLMLGAWLRLGGPGRETGGLKRARSGGLSLHLLRQMAEGTHHPAALHGLRVFLLLFVFRELDFGQVGGGK